MLSNIRQKISQYKWFLAYGDYSNNILINGLRIKDCHIINNPYVHKWFADPFILENTPDYLQVLVEEFDDQVNRGRIARLVIDKHTDTITDCNIVLDLSTHLSFPAIYRVEGHVFVHPENSASGNSIIYEYDADLDKLVTPKIILNKPLTDAIIIEEDGLYSMYTTQVPISSKNRLDVYQSNFFLGPYTFMRSIDYGYNNARMAGHFIHTDSKIVRPSQDNNHDYGEAVLFYDNTEIIGEIRPSGLPYEGVHTFNVHDNTFIIDLKKYDFPAIHYLLKNILYFVKSLKKRFTRS